MKAVNTCVFCLAIVGLALVGGTDAFAADQSDTQQLIILTQGGGGGGSGGGSGGGTGGGTGGGMGSGGSGGSGMGSGSSGSGMGSGGSGMGSGSSGSGMGSGGSSGSSSEREAVDREIPAWAVEVLEAQDPEWEAAARGVRARAWNRVKQGQSRAATRDCSWTVYSLKISGRRLLVCLPTRTPERNTGGGWSLLLSDG